MASIDELMEGKKPGEIKISPIGWRNPDYYLIPYFKDASGIWHFLTSDGKHDSESDPNTRSWRLYTEPKKKVKRWLWMEEQAPNEWCIDIYYMSEFEAMQRERMSKRKRHKLSWSETEFDE